MKISIKTTVLFLLARNAQINPTENYFQFSGKHHLQTHSTAMGTRQQLPLPTFSWYIETQSLVRKTVFNRQHFLPCGTQVNQTSWFSSKKQAYITLLLIHGRNSRHLETMFLDSVVYISTRFNEKAALDLKTHFKTQARFTCMSYFECFGVTVSAICCLNPKLRLCFVRNWVLLYINENENRCAQLIQSDKFTCYIPRISLN